MLLSRSRVVWTGLLLALLAGNALAGAKEDVIAASHKVLALKSYHVTMSQVGKGGMRTETDFVAPDRYRMTMPMGTQTIIGDTMFMSMQGRTMKLPLQKGLVAQWRDPAGVRENEAKLSATALGSETVDGKPAKKYAVRNADHPDLRITMWIGASGFPVRIDTQGKGTGPASATTTLRYSRFNDPTIRIAAP